MRWQPFGGGLSGWFLTFPIGWLYSGCIPFELSCCSTLILIELVMYEVRSRKCGNR